MLAEIELAVVAHIKNSALASRLRQVDTLPDLEGESLVARFTNDAPAVYVALGSFPVDNGYARLKYGIACVAKNSRSQQAARHGDGVAIGLHEMLDTVMGLINDATIQFAGNDHDDAAAEFISFSVVSCDLIASEALYQKGIYAGVVQVQSTGEVLLPPIPISQLADFKTFHADYDIEPQALPGEHQKWAQEPPDHSTSAPELSDTISLQE